MLIPYLSGSTGVTRPPLLIDEKHSDMDELPVTFVAVKIRNLPSNRFMESMSLSNRVRSLELQMSEFLSTNKSYATSTMSATTIPPGNTAVRPSNRNVTSQPLPRTC